ncbi:hypothetical protein H4J38_06760 [Colwellia sp. BRX10-3]|uniref:helix-turn-helix transcriptional regulator n=1 Tax=Colwellia sp. BRX10-3 TaxID=2759844 RepID=UPI0015F4CBD5|nr:hypothetical protein [Colwellia sp. BRX10-3]MBA6390483.1 hypothetical protein [Colwellia sp. BRX10-3]
MNENTSKNINAIEVMHRLDISESTLRRRIGQAIIPKPCYVGNKRYWNEDEIFIHMGW